MEDYGRWLANHIPYTIIDIEEKRKVLRSGMHVYPALPMLYV